MNDYSYWEKALADPRALRAREFRITSDPQPGFYRTKNGHPVAIFWDEGELVMQMSGKDIHAHDQEDIWLHCAMRPTSEADYHQYFETGKWADMDAAVQRTLGDNIRDASDLDTLWAMLTELMLDAGDYATIEDDETAKRAAGLRNRINELRLKADTVRKVEKEPHLKAGQEVDALWQPIIKDAQNAADRLRKSMSAWETAKLKAAREAEAAQAAKIWPEQGLGAIPEPSAQIRPAYGKAQAVKLVRIVTSIVEPDLLFKFLSKHNTAMLEAYMMELAQKAVHQGFDVPGVIIEEQARV